MKAHKHFRDASAWIAKAPPIPHASRQSADSVVLQFPTQRIRHGRDIGLAEGCKVLRPSPSQAWRWRHRRGGSRHAG